MADETHRFSSEISLAVQYNSPAHYQSSGCAEPGCSGPEDAEKTREEAHDLQRWMQL